MHGGSHMLFIQAHFPAQVRICGMATRFFHHVPESWAALSALQCLQLRDCQTVGIPQLPALASLEVTEHPEDLQQADAQAEAPSLRPLAVGLTAFHTSRCRCQP